MAEIRWMEEAVARLSDIYEFISEDNPVAVHKVVEGIYEKAQVLKIFPKIGYEYQDETRNGVRSHIAHRFLQHSGVRWTIPQISSELFYTLKYCYAGQSQYRPQ